MYARVRTLLLSDKLNFLARGVFLGVLAAALVFYVVYTRHWPMLVNAPVMHYVNFLMSHGFRPYSEITDMNMPGAYLLERCGMFLFGAGDLGWRIYDLFLLAVIAVSMVVIVNREDWLAGMYAAGLFALRHGSEGPWFAGEREQEMAALLIAGCALLFLAVRRKRPVLAFGFGLLAGLATSIKPTLLPFDVLSLVILWLALRRRGAGYASHLLWSAGGLCAAFSLSLFFLWRYHAFHSFLFVLRAVTPVYASLNDPGWRFLVKYAAPHEWLALIPLAGIGLTLQRTWNWERSVILLGTVCGLFSYLAQRKGFWYQRYMFLVFGLLLVSMAIFPAGKRPSLRLVSYLGLLYATVYLIPLYIREFSRLPGKSALTVAMEADLSRLGGDRLQGQVQCFDITLGCLNSLYHLGLVENTGFTGDMLLFPTKPNPATTHYREMFWNLQAQHPAGVIVLTNQEFGAENSFSRVERWPKFADDLARNYTLAISRSFPFEDKYRGQAPAPAQRAPTYRIYLRKGEKFPPLAAGS